MLFMKKIYCVGFMGVGKTTLTKEAAHVLQMRHIDTDELLENGFQQSISQWVAQHDMTTFRIKEHDLLVQLDQTPITTAIISTGGGIVENEENRDILRQNHVIYLYDHFETIYQRLIQERVQRPLVQQLTKDELYDVYKQRQPFYEYVADDTIELSDNITQNTELLIKAILNMK